MVNPIISRYSQAKVTKTVKFSWLFLSTAALWPRGPAGSAILFDFSLNSIDISFVFGKIEKVSIIYNVNYLYYQGENDGI